MAATEPSGGVIRTGEVQRNFNSGTYLLYGATRTYLSADGQTKVVQRYQVNSNIGNGVYEEYRYDALGRRVLLRSRKTPTPPPGGGTLTSLCTVVTGNPCASSISRWVWDGAQLLGETRAPGQDGLSAPALDQLTGSPPSFGVVGYVHIGGWDEPRALMDGRVFNPNWRGLPESSQLVNATAPDCSFGLGGSCIAVNWPTDVGPYYRQPIPVPQGTVVPTWLGSLAANGASESRRLHRRFREYDPATGQFTKEDPIGLAGGANLYGFANGDPVNFADPFGLQGCTRDHTDECGLRSVLRNFLAGLAASGTPGFGEDVGHGFNTGLATGLLLQGAVARAPKGTAISQQEAAAGVTANTRGLERQLARHIKKLEDYRANPEAFDNQGLLRKAPSPEIRQQIIEGRIRKLESQIRVFQREIEKRRGIT